MERYWEMDRDGSARTLRDHYREAAIAANLNRGRTPSPPRSMLGMGLDQDITTASISKITRHFVRDEFGISANTAQHIGDGVAFVAGAGLSFGQIRGLRRKPAAKFSGSRVSMPGQGFRVQRGFQPTQSGSQVLLSRRQDFGVGKESGRVPAQRAHSAVVKSVEQGTPKLLWSSWRDYPKVDLNGRKYAKIGDRLYTQHAVERMMPEGFGKGETIRTSARNLEGGRNMPPSFVEYVLKNGKKTVQDHSSGQRLVHTLDRAEVITDLSESVVITVHPKKI